MRPRSSALGAVAVLAVCTTVLVSNTPEPHPWTLTGVTEAPPESGDPAPVSARPVLPPPARPSTASSGEADRCASPLELDSQVPTAAQRPRVIHPGPLVIGFPAGMACERPIDPAARAMA
ncbi:hypothetical protein [Actinokineospora sp. NBRC 105648]|uniref:hypothetical protein n=1 Tax=Actinokineospora sp. NBRC 105648 TaxID=3032206 RepID=UPI0024A0BA86|nr:hypothetical protein [Actinokineospora sp. NBRC 105648]GLZ36808.1 hypothetical protein Acsp05_04330 [Actinokineospora sp. NBRC 105648]